MISTRFPGQLTAGELVDRYDLACRPVRDLLVDYLRERQPGIDYSTLTGLATTLALWFWKDLENCHPGIDSLRLPPDIAAGWKRRIQTRTVRTGGSGEQVVTREAADDILITVRAFYLDLAQWALDEPARWGPWAVPCPVRGGDIQHKKQKSRTKARMDQRTRERLPVLPALAAAVDRERKRRRSPAGCRPRHPARRAVHRRRADAAPGPPGPSLPPRLGRRPRQRAATRPDPRGGQRILGMGLRGSASSHGRPDRGADRALAPQPGAVPAPLIRRAGPAAVSRPVQDRPGEASGHRPGAGRRLVRHHHPGPRSDGAVPLAAAYDTHECTWNPPMPLLFQRVIGLENRPIPAEGIRDLLRGALAASAITGADGKPLDFRPHDFRRVFTTDAILNGMPPHIAQLILGHNDINTTMGYKAVYPEEAIRGHRAFITRRRQLRPSEEYWSPSDAEWEEFLGHFERRRVALGDCGRAYSTSCIHEHSCVRCPLLRIDPDSARPARRHPRQPPDPHRRGRDAKAGPARPKGSGSASPPRTTSSPRPTRPPPAVPRPSTSPSPPTATSPPRPYPLPGDRHDR